MCDIIRRVVGGRIAPIVFLLLPLQLLAQTSSSERRVFGNVNINVGQASDVGWTDGICYRPISDVRPGDTLTFAYGPHDVYRMSSRDHLDNCDFTDGIKLAGVGDSPFVYTVTEQDALDAAAAAPDGGGIHFACSVGAHCSSGLQRLSVQVTNPSAVELIEERNAVPESDYLVGVGESECNLYQSGVEVESGNFLEENALRSTCTEAVLGEDGRYHVSCLSGPATLTPGGVMNSARIMHYPYPTDRRVVVGTRTWEFVSGDPIPGTVEGVEPVPINQLYVHHLSGRVILGQGTEGIRRSEPDAPFPTPYGSLTGDEGDLMIFHIIDLREVDEWLECVECRCRDPDTGTYLDTGGGDGQTGGVSCCTNCTALEGPTMDYRMRYNVSYSDIPDDEPITDVQMLTADISPVVGKQIEFDVPSFNYLKPENRDPDDPHIQRLVRTGPFKDLFKMEFFGDDYSGPETVKLLRCVGHLHIAALGMWLEDATTGEMICSGAGTDGTGPDDKGFLTAIEVESYDPPLEFPADREVRLVTEYNATILHTGVMGMWFAFISSDKQVKREEASLQMGICKENVCDVSLLPAPPSTETIAQASVCFDALQGSPACRFASLCSCEEFINHPDSSGCGGVFTSEMGDIEVNSLCALSCDACPKTCEDELPNGPACNFAGLCSCEDFVNAPESTGCGGVYVSEFGELNINEQCAAYCDACPDTSNANVIQEQILEKLEEGLGGMCKYATADCKRVLTNLYSCASGWAQRTDDVDANVDFIVKRHGKRLALKHSKLGSPSLHRNAAEDDAKVLPCSGEVTEAYGDAPPFSIQEEESNNSGAVIGAIIGGLAVVALSVFAVFKLRARRHSGHGDAWEEGDKFDATRRETGFDTVHREADDGFAEDEINLHV